MAILYEFDNVQIAGMSYTGHTASETIMYDDLCDIILSTVSAVTKIQIYVNDVLIITFNQNEVLFADDSVRYRLWVCASIYNKLQSSSGHYYMVITESNMIIKSIIYEMMKFANMMNHSMRVVTV